METPASITNARMYLWGNSLIDHATGLGDEWTKVPTWVNQFALEAGNSFAANGAFGFGQDHVADLPSPPTQLSYSSQTPSIAQVSVADNLTVANWLAANINVTMFTPANFRQGTPADQSHSNPFWTDITTQTTNSLFSHAETSDPNNATHYIYEHWTDMGPYTSANFSSTFPTTEELSTYWAANESINHSWFIDYQDAMVRDYASLNVKMIPVGYILGQLLTGTLSSVPASDLYEDNAPHGRPSLYFLAGLITYMSIYGSIAPTTYTVPANVNSTIASNFTTVVNEIWTNLNNFNFTNGNSRVFNQG
jgi:hypothetical protein